jgi:large subunit ribosomal protein L17
LIELVDFNEVYVKSTGEAKEGAKKTRRSRSSSKKTEAKTEETTKEAGEDVKTVNEKSE